MSTRITAAVFVAAITTSSAAFADDVASFYKGKSIDLIIASEVGGGYDAYAG